MNRSKLVALLAVPSIVLATACGTDDQAGTRQAASKEGGRGDEQGDEGRPGGGPCFQVCLIEGGGPVIFSEDQPPPDGQVLTCQVFCAPAPNCNLVCSAGGQNVPHPGGEGQDMPAGADGRECDPDRDTCDPDKDLRPTDPFGVPYCSWRCPEPPLPPCEDRCNEECVRDLMQKGLPEEEARAQCCHDLCQPPLPPCENRCTEECIKELMQKGLPEEEARAQCCHDPCQPPPPICPEQCDQDCIDDLIRQGIDKEEAFAKCCHERDCEPPPPQPWPPCSETCEEGCLKDLMAQGISQEEAYAKCCGDCRPEPPPPPPCDFFCDEECLAKNHDKEECCKEICP